MDPDFTIVMRGYERQEVDSYLRDLVAESTRLGERVAELEAQLERARNKDGGSGGREEGFRQLGEETTRILVAAESAAREMREKAERDASSALQAAERSAREQVETASENADRIVAEAEGRRREVEEEISRLDDVRATMVDNLRAAIRTAERSVEQLPPAGQAPGGGAEGAAATRPAVPARDEDRPAQDDRGEPTPDVRIIDSSVVEQPDGPAPAAGDPDGSAADQEPSARGADEVDSTGPIDPQEELAAEVALADELVTSDAVSDAAQEPEPEPEPEPEAATPEVDTAAPETAAPAAAVPDAAAPDADEEAPEADEPAAAADVQDATQQVTTESPQGADQGAVAAALADADEAAGRVHGEPEAGESDAGMLRERSLAGVRPGMLRRLRRGLQELQNGVLEAVRTRDEGAEAADLLPGDDDVDGLHDVARLFLDAGYRAGRTDAPVLTGGEPLQDPPTDTKLVGSTAELLAVELLDELRTTLKPSLRAGLEAEEPGASLSERVGEVFRDLKGPVVETVVDEHLTAIYGRAILAGWGEEGVGQVRWLLGEEARCPEGMCRANAVEGTVALGTPFPSGHAVPLAHEGCTCALEPA